MKASSGVIGRIVPPYPGSLSPKKVTVSEILYSSLILSTATSTSGRSYCMAGTLGDWMSIDYHQISYNQRVVYVKAADVTLN